MDDRTSIEEKKKTNTGKNKETPKGNRIPTTRSQVIREHSNTKKHNILIKTLDLVGAR